VLIIRFNQKLQVLLLLLGLPGCEGLASRLGRRLKALYPTFESFASTTLCARAVGVLLEAQGADTSCRWECWGLDSPAALLARIAGCISDHAGPAQVLLSTNVLKRQHRQHRGQQHQGCRFRDTTSFPQLQLPEMRHCTE
jgi:hypothetical protein